MLPVQLSLGACGLTVVVILYMWAQRSFVTGRCIHWECGRRSCFLISMSQVTALATAAAVLIYDLQQAGAFGDEGRNSPVPCQLLFWTSNLATAGYTVPYLLRTFRLASAYNNKLRQRFCCVATARFVPVAP